MKITLSDPRGHQDWARIPESFHREIERAHVVVQEGGA